MAYINRVHARNDSMINHQLHPSFFTGISSSALQDIGLMSSPAIAGFT